VAELVSELLYAGKSLAEIAGYDDVQLSRVVFRRRDRYGRLLRQAEELPPGVCVDEDGMRVVTNPVPYAVMYRQVRQGQGLGRNQAEADWLRFLALNPKLGKGGA